MDKKETVQKDYSFLRDCFHNAMDQHDKEEIALALERQKEEDVCCAIAAFLELKVPEAEIMRLLCKFYGVNNIEEATKLIIAVKTENQINSLRNYLNELGMNRIDVVNYMREHHVRAQLHANSKLQNMAIDKLKVYFDKH